MGGRVGRFNADERRVGHAGQSAQGAQLAAVGQAVLFHGHLLGAYRKVETQVLRLLENAAVHQLAQDCILLAQLRQQRAAEAELGFGGVGGDELVGDVAAQVQRRKLAIVAEHLALAGYYLVVVLELKAVEQGLGRLRKGCEVAPVGNRIVVAQHLHILAVYLFGNAGVKNCRADAAHLHAVLAGAHQTIDAVLAHLVGRFAQQWAVAAGHQQEVIEPARAGGRGGHGGQRGKHGRSRHALGAGRAGKQGGQANQDQAPNQAGKANEQLMGEDDKRHKAAGGF
ncbi:hypothetical protein [Hymenobacter sp. UYCo722]|uniref:hypothetical protein n=1 Tax=Hymenobacter sp. UYCo722 TaxID=3156335 RepID=UPI0033961320